MGDFILTSIGSSDGENSQETLLIMLELITESLPELSRCPTINADIPIILHIHVSFIDKTIRHEGAHTAIKCYLAINGLADGIQDHLVMGKHNQLAPSL